MIVREHPAGELLLINQTDHSQLSGWFAAHWGESPFSPLEPYMSAVRGIAYHDLGWAGYEAAPRCHPETGRPYHYRERPFAPEQLDAYQWSIDWMTDIDSYAGLIINMHRTGLTQERYGVITSPPERPMGPLRPEMAAFNEKNEKARESILEHFTEREKENLHLNFRMLQICDLLSLYLCLDDPVEQIIGPTPTGHEESQDVFLTLTPLNDNRIRISPYPFVKEPLKASVPFRRLKTTTFSTDEQFQKAFYTADVESMEYLFVR